MTHNVGTADRVIRTILGLSVGAAGLYYQSWFGLVGLVFLGTALIGWCPAYLPFGISTCSLHPQGEEE
jgi:hypothetical protein